ncbi:MAG TPA: outer membrane beta-barrel protein, partial [Caulobacteraceae bacterium]
MRPRNLAPLGGAALALLLASAAAGAEPNGWYSAWDVGAHWDNGTPAAHSAGLRPNGLPAKWRLHTKTDWAAFARLGYRFDPNWRAELELGWRNGSLSSFHGSAAQGVVGGPGEPIGLCASNSAAGACGTPRGYSDQLTGMVNLIYDFFPDSTFHPFVGAGVGVDYNKARLSGIIRVPNGNPVYASPEFFHVKGDQTHFAWQVIGGAAFDLSPQWALDVTYRGLGSRQTLSTLSIPTGTGIALPLGEFSHRTWDNSVTIGLRYMFAP